MKYILFALLIMIVLWFVIKQNPVPQNEIPVLDGKVEITFKDNVTQKEVDEFLNAEKFEIEKFTFRSLGFSIQFIDTNVQRVKKMLDTSSFIVDYKDLGSFRELSIDTSNLNPEQKKTINKILSFPNILSFWIFFSDEVNEEQARELIKVFPIKLILQVFQPEKSVIIKVEKNREQEIIKKASKNKMVAFAAFIADHAMLPVDK